MKTKISVIIPTLNESVHIVRAVRSAVPLGDVYVVDSGSQDATVALARQEGAQVYSRDWLGHAGQKNWALDNLPLTGDWVLFLDADEYISETLALEISHTVSHPEHSCYFIPRRNVFMGKLLRHVWWYPDYQLRLFRKGTARYEDRLVHEHMVYEGSSGHLSSALYHESVKGVLAFLERHVRYAEAEAIEMERGNLERGKFLSKHKADRRRALKVRVWYRLPARPLIRLLWLLFVRRAYLDGVQGIVYAGLIASYEVMIDAFRLQGRLGNRTSDLEALSRKYP